MKNVTISPLISWKCKNAVDLSIEFCEPCLLINQVFVAICDYEMAFVLYEYGGMLYFVEVYDCYEYGLENEWKPIKTDIDEIRKLLDTKTIINRHINKLIRSKLSAIKRFMK